MLDIHTQIYTHTHTLVQTNNNGGPRRRTFKHRVHEWGLREVGMWLSALGLDQYEETFSSNEITGSVLVELGQSDLDYMQIRALGHRKVIMREIERLKRGKSTVDINKPAKQQQQQQQQRSPQARSPTQRPRNHRLLTVDSRSDLNNTEGRRFRFSEEVSPQQQQRQESAAAAAHSSSSRNSSSTASSKTAEPVKQHWSHIKPLSENEVSGSGAPPVNLADGVYDEGKQADAFKDAVMAWRNGGTKSTTLSSSSSSSSSSEVGGGGLLSGGGMWNNPLASSGPAVGSPSSSRGGGGNLANGTLDDAAEAAKFREAVAEWRRGGKPKEPKTSEAAAGSAGGSGPVSNSPVGHREGKRSEKAVLSSSSSSSNFDGPADEAGEHERFQQAVMAWREGKTADGPRSPGQRSAALANDLLKKMSEADEARRARFAEEKAALEREMRKERDALRRQREEAAAKLAASKYSDEGDQPADGSLTARSTRENRDYSKKWKELEIEY